MTGELLMVQGSSGCGETGTGRAGDTTGRQLAAAKYEQQVLGAAGQLLLPRTKGPVEVVSSQYDVVQVGTEVLQVFALDPVQHELQAIQGDVAVETQGNGDVEPVDD